MENRPIEHQVTCPCGARMKLKYSKVYNKYFYGCSNYPACKNTHGADKEGKPLGIPADSETRQLRQKLHKELDKYYASGMGFADWNDKATFLNNVTGKVRIADLTKDECRKLLNKLGKNTT